MFISKLFKSIRPSRIRSQLILGVAVVNVALMTLLVIELMDRQRAFFLKLNRDRALSISLNFANAANSYVVSYELDGLQKLVATYKKIPGLEYALITSDDGTVLAHNSEKIVGLKAIDSISKRLKPIESQQLLIENSQIIDVATPIVDDGEIVGWARIGLSQEYIEPSLSEIKRKGLIYIFFSLVVGSLFAVIVAGSLSKGLRKLVEAAERIKGGNRGIRVSSSSSFEVEQLGIAFNQMLDDISSNEKLLGMVLENLPVGVMILDADGKIESVNPAAYEIWKGIEYVGANEYDRYKAWFTDTGIMLRIDDWGAAIVLKEGRPVLNQELEIECFDKTRKVILNSALPLRDAQEKTVGIILINVDITERKTAENTLRRINHEIGERAKELRCLYRISQIANDPDKTVHHILQECVKLIPSSYQYPHITFTRIKFKGQIFKSENFVETPWKQEAGIISKGAVIGKVEVYYKEKMPDEAEGPFLKEERLLISSIVDIIGSAADRRYAENELEQSEERHRALVENISDSIILVNEQYQVIYRSQSTMRTIGYDEKELDIHPPCYFIHPDDERICHQLIAQAKRQPGQQMHDQFRLMHKNGNYIWVEGSIINLLSNSSVRAFILNYRDITERKKFEEQQLLITSIVNSTNDAIISKSLKGVITSWNKGAEQVLGYSSEEIIGKPMTEIVPPHLAAEEAGILKNIREGRSVDYFETKRLRKDRTMIDVSATVSPIRDSTGMVTGASIILHDIRAAKKAAESIRQSEANYRQLFELSPAAMCVIDEETLKFIQVNKACISDYGYSEQEFLQMSFDDIVFSENEAYSKELLFIREQTHIKRSGEQFDVRLSSIPIVLNGQRRILVIGIDITEKNLYEQRLAKAAIRAQEEERFEIGSELHDDVGQLLMTSLIFLGGLKKVLPPDAHPQFEETKLHITKASREIRNLSHRLAPTFFDNLTLHEAFDQLLTSFNNDGRYEVFLNFNNDVKQLPVARDLQLNLFRILQEQLKNIFKHAKATKIKVSVEIAPDNMLELKIRDNGVGFEVNIGKGGIGLTNMQRRVRLFRGTFAIHSSVGNGCEILVHIPIMQGN